ncbi:hypothetical protein LIX17_25395 (plasmid) [Mycobacterium avium subsp. hominissuis]|uniref:hypothetical protein n=1 Tax=Mycobacterium avium TaxID=1764 RepID=UPI00314029C4
MDTTSTSHLSAVDSKPGPSADAAGVPEPTGTVWIDFGDGGSARWADLSLPTLDQICAHLETIKPADTLT